MKCDFCSRDVPDRTAECPYCHYRFQLEPEVLVPEERDNFEGVTIEEDGTTSTSSDGIQAAGRGRAGNNADGVGQFKVRTFGCSSSFIVIMLILSALVILFFFLLPVFAVFAAVFAAIYLLRSLWV